MCYPYKTPNVVVTASIANPVMPKTILIADDEQKSVVPLTAILEAEGYAVDAAADGQKALDLLVGPDGSDYVVALVDQNMPKLDGMSLLTELRQRQHPVQVIVITGAGSVDLAVEAMRQGAYDFLARVMAKSVELVPVDTGTLKDSAYISVSKSGRNAARIQIEAGYSTDYAEVVHERVEIPHKIGQAKFLEQPWNEEAPDAHRKIATWVSRARSSGVFGTSGSFGVTASINTGGG